MKYAHIDSNNFLLGWYTTELHASIPTPNVEVSESVWNNAINNSHNHVTNSGITSYVDPRTISEREADARAERDYILKHEADPVITNPLRWAEMTTAKQAEWANYRTTLLDISEQSGFPDNITWPVKPQ